MLHIRKVGHLILNLYLYIRHILLNFAVQELLKVSGWFLEVLIWGKLTL